MFGYGLNINTAGNTYIGYIGYIAILAKIYFNTESLLAQYSTKVHSVNIVPTTGANNKDTSDSNCLHSVTKNH